MKIEYTSERRDSMNGWSRTVRVGDQEYCCSVSRGKSVRVPYHKKRGFHWHGSVYRITTNHGRVWAGRVEKSTGCAGLLMAADVIPPKGWTAPKYPGDTVKRVDLKRGDEFGFVAIQNYGPDNYRVVVFLPGYETSFPGDTPKMNPDEDKDCETVRAANYYFDYFVRRATNRIENAWQEYRRAA